MEEKKKQLGGGVGIKLHVLLSLDFNQLFSEWQETAKPASYVEISHSSEDMKQVLGTFSVLAVFGLPSYHFLVQVHISSSNKNITRINVLILKMKPKTR